VSHGTREEDQVIERPGVGEPELVKATPPSGKS
jgi:hypothetical protein